MKNSGRQAFRAPWGALLTGISGGVVVLFIAIYASGNADGKMMVLFPLLLVLALPFIIRGYKVSDGVLIIKRLGWETRFPLDSLRSVAVVPNALRGSIRLCGNGGLFVFAGLYRNKALGKFRAFVNDLNKTVVLCFAERTIVVSPDDPVAFVQAVEAFASRR
ncbi:PH domain-containing protein [Pontiella sulfatireligans]|uniref:Bacterial Pleckstrin homology domain-containing protein n=1 Tax=Pontiella sulfatireligans TaxID=2750658 RepID=A0A6C2UR19_9BACT|nr:PH domain-containing protein [Pontiella sulfatireligans]VGO21707.1 hypothetical protein SCARR_03781 [Pontiella sulfatireligans]